MISNIRARNAMAAFLLFAGSSAYALDPACSPIGDITPTVEENCYLKIEANQLDNIQFDPQAADAKVLFRIKADPAKRFAYRAGSNLDGAKGLLAVLLTSVSTGLPVNVWIVSGKWSHTAVESSIKDVVLSP